MTNKLLENVWAKYLFILALIAGLTTGLNYMGNAFHWWNTQNYLPTQVKNLNDKIDLVVKGDSLKDVRIQEMMNYIESKKQSFAVGFRVMKNIDEHTGEETWIKQYRDFKGKWNNIYLDLEMSEYFGVEQYYYIDQETQEKEWCL